MVSVLSIRDQRAVVHYALDRIDEAIAQAWMREFCTANGILVHTLRDANNTLWAMEQRIRVAVYLRSKRVKHAVIAKLMHRHYDMIRYYMKPTLRARKQDYNRLNTGRWRKPDDARGSPPSSMGCLMPVEYL